MKNRFWILLFALSLLLTACGGGANTPTPSGGGQSHVHSYGEWTVLAEPMSGQPGQMERGCGDCGHSETADIDAASLVKNGLFLYSPRRFNQRLNTIGSIVSGFTAELELTDWSAQSNLYYNGEIFAVVRYFHSEGAYPEPLGAGRADEAAADRIVVTDYLEVVHPQNAFAAILMTFDPLMEENEVGAIRAALEELYPTSYESDAVTEHNGLYYGYSSLQNQLINSASFCIRPGDGSLSLCSHDWESEINTRGLITRHCRLCDIYAFPPEEWTPLSRRTVLDSGNEPGSTSDVCTGDWTDTEGLTYPESVKFWVTDQPGWSNMEFVEYSLGGNYSNLSFIVAHSSESERASTLGFVIYLDGEKICDVYDLAWDEWSGTELDVSGGDVLRIECITDSPAQGHGLFNGALYG
ncbi:MAG: hypothetical protein IJA75_00880 [Oscillospiraceae bacterium]|nr:hypothetical protein [Oscillospiraceae bacterium]